MLKTIRFPIKGTFYYDATPAFTNGVLLPKVLLNFITEPNNAYDANAIQIWHGQSLLGYVPRLLAKQFPPQPQQLLLIKVEQHRRFLWLECQLCYECTVWQHLKLLLLSAIVRGHYRLKLWLNFR